MKASNCVALCLVVLAALIGGCQAAERSDRPNVVIILADDLGYGDVRANNPNSPIPTPHLDALAAGGVRFTDAHSPSAVCTPTRYGLVTGRYCWRSKMKRGVLNGYSAHLIDPDRYTIADLMKDAGYNTACIGKWHLGMDMPKQADGKSWDWTGTINNGPNVNGFDYFYGITASLDFPPYVYVENDQFATPVTGRVEKKAFPAFWREGELGDGFVHRESLDHLTEKVVGYIAEHAGKDEPFFLYFPLTSPHKPTLPAERFVGKSGIGPYGDFIIQTDDVLGRVDQALQDAGVKDNTLVIFTSDNGSYMYRYSDDQPDHTDDDTIQAYRATTHTANHIYRGTKADIHESGHRVYFAARLPGTIEPGSVADRAVSHVDLLATLADLTGQDVPADAADDSYSMLPLMLGESDAHERAPVIMHSGNGTFAIRKGKWKLIAGSGSGGRGAPRSKPFDRPYQLYDLESDPSETTSLIEERADVARTMEQLLLLMLGPDAP